MNRESPIVKALLKIYRFPDLTGGQPKQITLNMVKQYFVFVLGSRMDRQNNKGHCNNNNIVFILYTIYVDTVRSNIVKCNRNDFFTS